jgi:hypothetical protein
MATLIDDATATEYFNGIENAPEDKRQQMADDLLAWGNAKQEQEYNSADDHFSKLFTDQAYFEKEKATNTAVLESPDPDQAAKRTLIGAYMEHKMGRPIDTMSYQVERDAFSMSAYGQKNINDGQLFDFISGDYKTQQKKTEALNDLHMQSVGKAIKDAQLGQNRPFVDGMTDVFNQWQQKYPELVDGTNDAAFLSQAYKLYYDTFNDLDSVRPQAAQTLTTLEKFTKGESDPEALQTLSNTLIGASPEERQKIYKYVTLAAEAGHIDRAGLDQFAINMGQSFSRGFDFIPQGSLQIQETGVNEVLQAVQGGQKVWVPQNGDITKATVSDKTPVAQTMAEAPTAFLFSNPQKAYREATPEEADQFSSYAKNAMEGFKVVRELRNVAKTGVDPIRPVLEENSFWGTAERGAYGLAGSIPLMGATAVNPFLGVIAYQANEYDRIMLENQDINPQFAQGLALVEGVANAAIDRVQLKSLSGKLPMFGRYLDRIKSDGIRRTVKIGTNVVEQNLQEGAQDLIAPVLETAVAALREDMPDKDFSSLMEGWAGQRPETFFATLPLSLIGGGVASYRDIKNPSAELNATKLRMAGFSPEQTTFIQRAENPEEYTARIQMEFPNRTPENIQAGEDLIQQSISEAQNPPENSAKLEETVAKDGTRMWTVTTPDGKELLTTKDQQAALDAIAQHGHAQILNKQFETQYEPEELRQIINDRIANWTSQDSNNTLVMESEGMNAQQKLEQLQAAGNAAQIQELHNRIANSHLKDTPYEQINILGEASVDDVAEMVFGSLITINPNTRPENLREEIHHTAVKVALKNGSVTLDTLRGWLDATEKALPGTFQNLVRDTEGDIVESLAQVQAAYEDGKIDANEASALPASFIDYIKNMMRTFAEVLRRAVALRGAFKDGALPAEYESFLADSVGLNQQARVDTARERVSNEVLTDTNYSIGTNPFPMEQKGKWWANEDFAQRGGRIVTMSPDEFLSQVRPLEVDEASRDNIDDLKNMMQSGRKLDPLAIYGDGKEDGRHRATAAKELGMDAIPVLDFRANKPEPKGNDFSIGSRASAVSTDTPSIRASNATITGPANYSIAAFHGTPHKVDKFSTAKIGTGEGAQVYGWGLYFAQEKDVADKYANDLSKPEFTVKNTGEVITETDSRYSDLFERYKRMNSNGYSDAFAEQIDVKQGNLYTVELDVEPEDLLDWDKPFSEQSPKVQNALAKYAAKGDSILEELFSTGITPDYLGVTEKSNGSQIYNTIASGDPKKASEALLAAGIPGIRYLDGDSRNSQGWKITPPSETVSGKWMVKSSDYNSKGLHFDTEAEAKTVLAEKIAGQTYNYVAFDENLIKITEENGNRIPASQALAAPATGATNYSVGFAPNGKPSNLKPEEQALARSPEFKARFGDWEALASLDKDVVVVVVKDDGLVGATIKELRKNAIQQTRSWWGSRERNTDLDADILINRDTLEHLFTHRGPIQVHAALHVPEIIRSARKVSDEEHEPASKSIAKVHRLVSAINFRESIHRVDIVVKEHFAPKGHHAYDIEAITVKTETAEKGLPSEASSAKRIGTSAVSLLKVRDLNIGVNPESVTVKTDENGEPLASEIARFRQETGTSSYSIASQSEIDRVNKALGGMNRGPDERLKVYERAKNSFSRVMQENKEALDAIRSSVSTDTAPATERVEMDRAGKMADVSSEEKTELEKALQDNADTFLPRIEAAQTPAERKKVERDAKDRAKILEQGIRDKFAERKKSVDAEAKSQRDQIVQAAAAKDSASNARMRDKVRNTKLVNAIGELDGILKALPPEVRGRVGGFAVLANIGTGDKALADFFVQRIDMIDRQLERTLKEEYGTQFDALLERTKPKKAKAGEKPKGIGADIQSLFAAVREARGWNPDKVDGHIADIETQIAAGNLTPEEEAWLTREADLVSLAGDWKNADSSRRAAALEAATETWAKGMYEFVQKKMQEREARDIARAKAIKATGKKGDYPDRRARSEADNGLKGKSHGWLMDTMSWDQVAGIVFGHESAIAIELSDGQRKAEYAKIDAVQAKEDAIHDLFTQLAGGSRLEGEKLMWKMSQPSIDAGGLNLSQLEALSPTMLWAQEDGRRHMIGQLDETGIPTSRWHYNQQFIDDIESQLSPEAKAVRDFLWDSYGKGWFSINSVYRDLNGISLPRIFKYSPVTVNPINVPAGMVSDPVTGNAVSAGSISPGALRTRGTAIAQPNFRNVISTYIAHTRQMEHWKAFAPWTKEANGILRNRDVQDSIHEAGGEEANKVLNRFLDAFAQGGNRDASLGLEISQTLSRMTSRAAQVALVGRVGTLAIQFTQIGAASAELPMGAYVSRLGKLMTGNLSWTEALNSPYIQRRIKQMPPSVQIAMEGLKAGKPNQLKHQVTKVGQLISGSDALWTAGTYAMVYDYHLGQAKSFGYTGQAAEEYAHNTAERVTDRLAQPTRMGARSIYEITSTNPGSKLGWAFASEARKNLALLAYTKANRSKGQFGTAALGFVLFNLAMGAFIRNAWKDMKDDDDEELFDDKTWNWKRIGVAMLTEPLQGIPYLGDYIEKGINAALGQYQQSSDLISFERGVRAIKHIPDIIDGERDMEGVLKDIDGMVSLMGMFNQTSAAAASLTHIASDFFGVAKNTTTED